MSDALRQLLASFVVEVDKAGELAKGNAAIDALKQRLIELQEAAKPAAKAVNDAFAGIGAQLQKNLAQLGAKDLMKSSRGGDAFAALAGLNTGPQFGPTRDTLNAGRADMAASDAAAAKYATTLRGRLAGAVKAVRDGFNGGSGVPTEGGPGLLDRLLTFRNTILALGAGRVVRGMMGIVEGLGAIKEGAERLGISTDQFQRLRVLAEQNGTSVEALGIAFRNLSNAAVEPTKQTADAFKALGVTVKDGSGNFKSANDLFFDTTVALAGVTDETRRNALAQDLLGRSALELKPLFANGTKAALDQKAAIMGLTVVSKETIESAKRVSDTWHGLGLQFLAAAEPLLKILIPGLAKLTKWIMGGVGWIGKFLKQTDLVSIGLTALGAVLSITVLPYLARMLTMLEGLIALGGGASTALLGMAAAGAKAAAGFVLLALELLVIEDFITFLRGGDTEIGRLLDGLFGKGAAKGTVDALHDLVAALKDVWHWLNGEGVSASTLKLWQDLKEALSFFMQLTPDQIKAARIAGGINPQTGEPLDTKGKTDLELANKFGISEQSVAEARGHAAPSMLPSGPAMYSGPPVAPSGASAPVQITANGDRNVTVNIGGTNATPQAVAAAASGALEDDRNRLLATHGAP